MRQFSGMVMEMSRILDRIAGFFMVALMVLVVTNVLLRSIFKTTILGTYEYVGFLTAAMIGLALAHCAVLNGHIAVGLVVDRLKVKTQAYIDIIVNVTALSFWGMTAWYVAKHANSMTVNGVVSPTTQTPFYPFIYLVAAGLLVLCLVLLVRFIESVKKAAFGK